MQQKNCFHQLLLLALQSLLSPKLNSDDLKLLLDRQREDVVLFYLIVNRRAPPDERQGNLSCIFTTSLSPEQYAVLARCGAV